MRENRVHPRHAEDGQRNIETAHHHHVPMVRGALRQKCLISYLIKSINKNSFSNEKIFSILRSERGQLSKLIKHDSITKLIFIVNFVQMHFLDRI